MVKNNTIEDIATLKADVQTLKTGVARIESKIDLIPQMFIEQKKEADATYARKEELVYILDKIQNNKTEVNKLRELVKQYGPSILVAVATVLGYKFL